MQVWKTIGRKPKQLEEVPPCPEELNYIWLWFREVCSGERLTYQELHYWMKVTGLPVKAWEIDIIRSLDRIYWGVRNEC